jgi:hypothetical protein
MIATTYRITLSKELQVIVVQEDGTDLSKDIEALDLEDLLEDTDEDLQVHKEISLDLGLAENREKLIKYRKHTWVCELESGNLEELTNDMLREVLTASVMEEYIP